MMPNLCECGERPLVKYDCYKNTYAIYCTRCTAESKEHSTRALAITAWTNQLKFVGKPQLFSDAQFSILKASND